jgi:hypothetical protein
LNYRLGGILTVVSSSAISSDFASMGSNTLTSEQSRDGNVKIKDKEEKSETINPIVLHTPVDSEDEYDLSSFCHKSSLFLPTHFIISKCRVYESQRHIPEIKLVIGVDEHLCTNLFVNKLGIL